MMPSLNSRECTNVFTALTLSAVSALVTVTLLGWYVYLSSIGCSFALGDGIEQLIVVTCPVS